MKKVFYSVKYNELGWCKNNHTMWFDNLAEAKKFAEADYRDNPVKHTYTSETTIETIERLIELQKN